MAKLTDSHLILCRTPKAVIKKGVPIMVKGDGAKVWDDKGNEYIDLTSA